MKSEIYKDQISPLMKQIIDICQEHHIAFVASFAVPSATSPGLECVSGNLKEECNPPPHLVCALGLIKGEIFVTQGRVLDTANAVVN